MARFNRTRLIEQLTAMAAQQQAFGSFDHKNGTAQLRPHPCDEKTDALIDRAVAYGRWRATQDFAEDLASGQAGPCCPHGFSNPLECEACDDEMDDDQRSEHFDAGRRA